MSNLNRREIMKGAGAAMVAGAAMTPSAMAFSASSGHCVRCMKAALAIRSRHDMAFMFREVPAEAPAAGQEGSHPYKFIELGFIGRPGDESPNQIVKNPQVEDHFVADALLETVGTGVAIVSRKIGVPMRDGSRRFLDQGTAVVVDGRGIQDLGRVALYMNPGEDPADSVWLFEGGVRIMEDVIFSPEPHGETEQVFAPRA